MKKLLLIPVFVLMFMFLQGCGSTSKTNLEKIIPENITTYKLKTLGYYSSKNETVYTEGTTFTQEITDIEVVSEESNGSLQRVDCEIYLKDENLTRTVFATLNLIKNGSGLSLDSWSTYHPDECKPLKIPAEEAIEPEVISYGYTYNNLEIIEEDDSQLDSGRYSVKYDVNDPHKYASYSGTLEVNGEFEPEPDGTENEYQCATFRWYLSLNEDNVTEEWDILGKWTLIKDENDEHSTRYEINIESLEGDNIVVLSGTRFTPRTDGDTFLTYDEETLNHGSWHSSGHSPAKSDLRIDAGNYVTFKFTPDELTCEGFGYSLEKYTAKRA